MKKIIWILLLCLAAAMATSCKDIYIPQRGTDSTIIAEEVPGAVNDNAALFVKNIGAEESAAEGAAQRLSRAGCGKIVEVIDVKKTERAYSMKITDDKGSVYTITMSDEGYLGTVVDENGKYLVMPLDD